MKKTTLFILIFLLIPFISAVDISLSNQNYQPQETLQAEITGNFPEGLELENIYLYKQGTPRPMPVIYDLKQYQGIYYLYMVLPNQEANFSVQIENTKYIEAGVSKTDTIRKEFIVQKTNAPAISINKGFVSATKDFFIKITGLYAGQEVNVELQASEESFGFFLPDGIEEELEFSIKDLESQKTILKINDYNIPIFITQILNETEEDEEEVIDEDEEDEQQETEDEVDEEKTDGEDLGVEETGEEKETKLEFQRTDISLIKSLTARIMVEEDTLLQIILKNIGEKDVEDIKISADFKTKIEPKKLDLKKGEQVVINMTVNLDEFDVDAKNRMSGKIKAEIENQEFVFPIFLEITYNESEVVLTGTSTTDSSHCSDIGEICSEDKVCDGYKKSSLEGPCCIGKCIEKKKPASKWMIGLFIISIILVLVALVYFRIKRKPKISPKQLLEKKTNQFRTRMKGDEVRGGLGNV